MRNENRFQTKRSFLILIPALAYATALFLPRVIANAQDADLRITYIANEGVLLTDGRKSVLIDALYRDGVAGYVRVPEEVLQNMEAANDPFNSVRAVLVTHRHDDHFDAHSVLQHLTNNPEATLVTSHQVADLLKEAAADRYETIADRVKGLSPRFMQLETIHVDGIRIDVIKLSHGTGRFADIWNLGYIIHLAGRRVLHIGDAEHATASKIPLQLHAAEVDVACLPYWWLYYAEHSAFVRDQLKPRRIVAFHVREGEEATARDTILAEFPDAAVCTERMTDIPVPPAP